MMIMMMMRWWNKVGRNRQITVYYRDEDEKDDDNELDDITTKINGCQMWMSWKRAGKKGRQKKKKMNQQIIVVSVRIKKGMKFKDLRPRPTYCLKFDICLQIHYNKLIIITVLSY